MYANFPNYRLITELVQNCWDENSTRCDVAIETSGRKCTTVTVTDDNPEGFKNLQDAYTLFRSTGKRSDPAKRGRFNLGEKLVLARSRQARITTTKGSVAFDAQGRRESPRNRPCGSEVYVEFPAWTQEDYDTALLHMKALYPPKGMTYTVNGETVPYIAPHKTVSATLTTEVLMPMEGGMSAMKSTKRKTQIHFYPLRETDGSAALYEMGIPVCDIEGEYNVDVQQKVPLDKDRTMVPQSYLQDIYAELAMALGDEMNPDSLSSASMRMALEDSRTDPETAANLFKRSFGDNAVLQSHDPDSDQEAVRHGAVLVPSRTYGADVNAKVRQGGIQTAKEVYCRDIGVRTADGMPMPGGYRAIPTDTPVRQKFARYVQMISRACGNGGEVGVDFAHWTGDNTAAMYRRGARPAITFNVFNLGNVAMQQPVSRATALILHELAHAGGTGHDGVYDREFENMVNRHTKHMAEHPEAYKEFEPELFEG